MAQATDYRLDTDGDLLFTDGDLAIGLSDAQHIKDIVYSNAGWWKQYPSLGVGLMNYYKSRVDANALKTKMRQQLESDGYVVGKPYVGFIDSKLVINPDAKRI